jgi:hypothetical protein
LQTTTARRRLAEIAARMDRSVESLIESAAEEAALDYFRAQGSDPATQDQSTN